MGILSGLFTLKGTRKSRDKPKNRINGSAYSFLMGGSSSGRRVNELSDMQMTAVYSCVRILSEAVASLPLHVYLRTDTGTEKAIDHVQPCSRRIQVHFRKLYMGTKKEIC